MSEATAIPGRPTPLDWALRPFSKVHRGEGLQALLLSLCLFFVLCGYYLMKTAREGMVLVSGAWGLRGEEVKSYGGGAMALLLVGLVPAYSALASRSSRLRLINGSYAGVIGSLLVFYVLAHLGVPIGLPFFVWIGLVNIFMVALFWSYATDLYTEEQGKRLFAIIAIGGSLGAIAGPELATRVSTFGLLPFAAVLLVAGLGMFNLIDRLNTRSAPGNVIGKQPIDGKGIVDLLFHNRYLLLIGALVFVAELVKTNGEYVLSSAATRHAALLIPSTAHPELVGAARNAAISADRRDLITAFYANFFLWVNVVSLLVQAFAVSRIIDKLGIRLALFVMPVIALGVYGAIGAIGGIAVIRAAKVTENASEYSLQNTVRHTLFLSMGRDTKYKVKAAIDTFVVRAADSLSAVVVWFSVHTLRIDGHGLTMINMGLIVVWIAIVLRIIHARKVSASSVQAGVIKPAALVEVAS